MIKWLSFFLIATITCKAQVVPHTNAHAHNDYEHERPLFEALQHGFTSIEADVHLSNGELLVSHHKPKPGTKTLEELYLKPLDSIIKKNNGFVYPGFDQPVFLMIDFKTDGENTYQALKLLLQRYIHILQNPKTKGPLAIFISGNRPVRTIVEDSERLVAIDGRPGDLEKDYSSEIMPVISDTYRSILSWNGEGTPGTDEIKKLKTLAERVHKERKKLRLWAIPDNMHAWQILLDAGVDYINTDKLEELDSFLKSKKI